MNRRGFFKSLFAIAAYPQLKKILPALPIEPVEVVEDTIEESCLASFNAFDFASKDCNRIAGKIAEALARKSAYMDILDGGTLENISHTVREQLHENA